MDAWLIYLSILLALLSYAFHQPEQLNETQNLEHTEREEGLSSIAVCVECTATCV